MSVFSHILLYSQDLQIIMFVFCSTGCYTVMALLKSSTMPSMGQS